MVALSRRALLGCLPLLAGAQVPPPSSELRRLRDPATEFEILRFTNPSRASYLPAQHLRFISQRSNFFIFCSEVAGVLQAFRMEVKTGVSRQLTEFPGGVRRQGVCLMPDDKSVCCLHEGSVEVLPIDRGKARTLFTGGGGWSIETLALSDNGRTCVLLERGSTSWIVRALGIARHTTETVLESPDELKIVEFRPKSEQILVGNGTQFTLLGLDTRRRQDLKTAPGALMSPVWTADGKRLLYLNETAEKRVILREHDPETGADVEVARTTQFITFARNSDATVFAGVSRSIGAPHVLLLLRVTRRELTLSEHKASAPADVSIAFTPDSQLVLYHTDRAGKPAIYGIPAERLVEKTDT